MKLLPASFKRSKKKMLIASVALLSIGLGTTAATGAWFTDQQSITANKLSTGTVKLGALGDQGTTTPLKFTNVVPVPDSTQAQVYNVNVVNQGSVPVNWNVKLLSSSSGSSSTTIGQQILVSYSVDGGKTWSQSASANAVGTIASTGALAAGSTAVVQFRAWLPSTTDNTAQGQTYAFDLQANAIQVAGGAAS